MHVAGGPGVPGGSDITWDEIARARPGTAPSGRWYRRLVARVVPPVVIGALLLWLAHPGLATAVVAVGTVIGVASAVAPAADRAIGRVLVSVGQFVGRVLTVVLLGLVSLLVLLPVAAVAAVVHRHPSEGVAAPGGWRVRPARQAGLPRRLYARETSALDPRAGWRLAIEAFGWVAVVIALDLALGWVWSNALTPYDAAARAVVPAADAGGADESDPASTTAMQSSPWAPGYYAERDSLEYEFVPFLTHRAEDHQGRFINITDGIRRSYVDPDLPSDAPTVWFFGGSTTWGEGQRDRHTIPSEVARLAEAAGSPIRVRNYGESGYVVWQELLQFEQALAVEEPPDLAVFYDGINEILTQAEDHEPGQPTIYNADTYTARLAGPVSSPGVDRQPVGDLGEAVWLWWREHSALARLTERVQAEFAIAPAAAQNDPFTADVLHEAVPETVEVYTRARSVLLDIAARHEVETLLTWQPDQRVVESGDELAPLERAAELIGAPTVDLTAALDGVDPHSIFIDGGHTNERGARLVAEAMWPLIEQALADQGELPSR